MDRIPETWKPYFKIAVGDPEQDQEHLAERSPRTYMEDILKHKNRVRCYNAITEFFEKHLRP